MKAFDEKVQMAAERFLQHRGYEIIDTKWMVPDEEGGFDIIAIDDCGAIAFIQVYGRKGGIEFEGSRMDRKLCEKLAVQYLSEAPEELIDRTFRFDVISILVLGEDRAIVRHHINCFGGEISEEDE